MTDATQTGRPSRGPAARRLPGLLAGLFLALLATAGTLPCPHAYAADHAVGAAAAASLAGDHPCGTDGHCALLTRGSPGAGADHGPVSQPPGVAAPAAAARLPYAAPAAVRTAGNRRSDGRLTYLHTLRLRL